MCMENVMTFAMRMSVGEAVFDRANSFPHGIRMAEVMRKAVGETFAWGISMRKAVGELHLELFYNYPHGECYDIV